MPRRRLTAQDAFIGVREPEPEEAAEETPEEEVGETAPEEELTDEEREELEREEEAQARRFRRYKLPPDPAEERATTRKRKKQAADLMTALKQMQDEIAAQREVERLTLYLPPEVSGQLNELWSTVRKVTKVKVGKSVLAGAALRIVLRNPELRAECAYNALREKVGGGWGGGGGEAGGTAG